MKKSARTLLLFILFGTSHTGWSKSDLEFENKKGNGGDVVVCKKNGRTSAEVLDLYEGRTLGGITPDFGGKTEYSDMVEFAINRVEKYDPDRARFYKRIGKIFSDRKFEWTDRPLPDVPDSLHRVIPPAHCKLHQIVIWTYPKEKLIYKSSDPIFEMNRKLWGLLDETNRAVLALHGAAWVYESFYLARNSKAARKINRVLFSKSHWDKNINNLASYIDYLSEAKARVYVQGRVRCDIYPRKAWYDKADSQDDLPYLKERWRPFDNKDRLEFCVGSIHTWPKGDIVDRKYPDVPEIEGVAIRYIEGYQQFTFYRENPEQFVGLRLSNSKIDRYFNQIEIGGLQFKIEDYIEFHPNGKISKIAICGDSNKVSSVELTSPFFKANGNESVLSFSNSGSSRYWGRLPTLFEVNSDGVLNKISAGTIELAYRGILRVTLRATEYPLERNPIDPESCGSRYEKDHFSCYFKYLSHRGNFQFKESDGSFADNQDWLSLVGDQELFVDGKPYCTKPGKASYVKFKDGMISEVEESPIIP